MSHKTRDAIRWAIAAMIVLVPITSFAYSVMRYGAVAAVGALLVTFIVAAVAFFLYMVISDVKLIIDRVLEDDE